jgi:uncharacterized protein RhaS with RHS repeats
VGRWTCQDPGGFLDDTNQYSYVADDPLNATDPGGLHYKLKQSNGKLTWVNDECGCEEERLIGYAPSGNGKGLNNPAYNDSTSVGPLPVGWYDIGGYGTHFSNDRKHRPIPHSRRLKPHKDNPSQNNRAGFLFHPGRYSQGCPLIDLPILIKKADGSEDDQLEVVP